MIFNFRLILLLCIICFSQLLIAQDKIQKKDSLEVYRDIEKYSKKRFFTKSLYQLLFKSVVKKKVAKKKLKKIKEISFKKFEGKIIRNIEIFTLDPFGFSDSDTTKIPKKFLDKVGNSIHSKTKKLAVLNLILIRKNKPLDSLLFKESERLIRKQRFVASVSTTLQLVDKDSVDIIIRVLDSWSLIPDFSSSSAKTNFYISDKNFFGTGHQFSNSYSKNHNGSQDGFSTSYTIPNIYNSYINPKLSYAIDIDGNYSKLISIQRPFFSPYARWGAGIDIGQTFFQKQIFFENAPSITQDILYTFQDFWSGHAYQIFKGSSEFKRATNLISSARYFHKSYDDNPRLIQDTLAIYSDEHLYLISLGISSRKFVQDKYIFNFNVTEDVATGFVYSITTGFQNKYNTNQFYAGAKVALGNYFEWGYLSSVLESESFLNAGKLNQSIVSFKVVYFTHLQEIGKWRLRQFIKPQLIIGNNRLDSNEDKLTLNGSTGITGFNSNTLFGTKKLLITFQTQSYSKWRLLGFRLNPFLNFTTGMLGNSNYGFSRSKLYSQIGLGVIISNDYLKLSSFQFSFSFYPNIPDGNSFFKLNSIITSDFGLQDFEISKPLLIDYR